MDKKIDSKARDPKIIVALDFPHGDAALEMADLLDPGKCRVKVGKELFTREGPSIVKSLQEKGFEIFLDLKFHDIPNTVAKACSVAADMGVWMLNVHASGGSAMLKAAREAGDLCGTGTLLIAVTVLTSMDDAELSSLGVGSNLIDQVMRLARLSHEAGMDGVVCSAQEASLLREQFGKNFRLVTPGIRPAASDQNDQRRVLTPQQALLAGSDYLVIGRPITRAAKPSQALDDILDNL